MRILSQVVTIIGLCVGTFAVIGLRSHGKTEYFLGLDIIVLQIDLMVGIFVLVIGLGMMLCVMVLDRVIEKAARRDACTAEGQPPTEDIPLCYTCLTPAKPLQHFCMNCWTPLTSHAEIDPIGHIYALGDMYWKLTRGPSKPIAMIGLSLLVGPPLIGLLVMGAVFVSTLDFSRLGSQLYELLATVEGITMFLAGLLYLAFHAPYGLVFIKAIRNYRRQDAREELCREVRQETRVESDSDDSDD